MGLRFQKRIGLLPGVRLNLSKRGVSASLGPRGADVNIGRGGVTANAGIPGTGLSWRQKVGGHGGKLGVLVLVAGLGVWAFQHSGGIATAFQAAQQSAPAPVNTAAPGVRYVHRAGAIIRDEPKTSARTLKKESKGASVTLVSEQDGWARVTDGNITGWMRASVLGAQPPR